MSVAVEFNLGGVIKLAICLSLSRVLA
jgi:hypothetical protein